MTNQTILRPGVNSRQRCYEIGLRHSLEVRFLKSEISAVMDN